jgi:predicted ribosome quality control (RQC) complex YloA/Tae2 family protein
MALDGIVVAALAKEFSEKLAGGRIDKIHQTEKDEIILAVRSIGQNFRLLLSANASVPRACLFDEPRKNPPQPPMFCMSLRKHLSGGKILSVKQPEFERILRFEVEAMDELGEFSPKTLILEMMGRHSNLILIDANDRVLDCAKRVDFTTSSVRQVLPGLFYGLPATQSKQNPLEASLDDLLRLTNAPGGGQFAPDGALDGERTALEADAFLVDALRGVSPLVGRELAFRALGNERAQMKDLNFSQRLSLATAVFQFFENVRKGAFAPCLLRGAGGKPIEFSAVEIRQYENGAARENFETASAAVCAFYGERARKERLAAKSAGLTRTVANNLERCAKKIAIDRRD